MKFVAPFVNTANVQSKRKIVFHGGSRGSRIIGCRMRVCNDWSSFLNSVIIYYSFYHHPTKLSCIAYRLSPIAYRLSESSSWFWYSWTSVYSGHLWKVTRLIQTCKLQLQTLVCTIRYLLVLRTAWTLKLVSPSLSRTYPYYISYRLLYRTETSTTGELHQVSPQNPRTSPPGRSAQAKKSLPPSWY